MRSLAIGAIVAGLAAPPPLGAALEDRLPTFLGAPWRNRQLAEPENTLPRRPAWSFYSTVQLFMFRDKLRVSER